MFSTKKGPQTTYDSMTPSKTDTTIIGSGSKFDGTLSTSGIVRVDGFFSGELYVEGSVIVGENGCIKGNIKSDKVTIAGKVEGNIRCSGGVELTASGRLYGDMEVKNVIIEDGAVFEGKCIMSQQSSPLAFNSRDNAESGDTDAKDAE